MLVTWSFPTTIVFGAGAVASCGTRQARGRQARARRRATPACARSASPSACEAARGGGRRDARVRRRRPEPRREERRRRRRRVPRHGADCIVSVGGGSPLDAGKLIALKVTHDRPLVDYDDATGGDRFIGPNVPPIITIPTTAGTGSEVGRSGVVTLAATGRKTVIFSPHLLAKAAILDPELTRSMPAARHRGDRLRRAHALPRGVLLARRSPDGRRHRPRRPRAVRRAPRTRAVEHGDDLEARGGMMKAAMMGAVAFQKGLGACHSLAHPLSSEKGMHHGLANALCLPAVVDFNEAVAPKARPRPRHPRPQAKTLRRGAPRRFASASGFRRALGAKGSRRPTSRSSPTRRSRTPATGATRARCTRDDLARLYEASL